MRKFSNICESIWMDIHRQSTGDAFRKEDQAVIDLMNEFVERHELRGFQYRINGDLTIDMLNFMDSCSLTKVDSKSIVIKTLDDTYTPVSMEYEAALIKSNVLFKVADGFEYV